MNFSLLAFSDVIGDIENYFANFETAADTCRTVMLWLAIALVIAFIAVKVALYLTAPKPAQGQEAADGRQKIANKAGLIVALAYAVAAIVAFSAFYFTDVSNDEDYLVPITFYPLLVFAVVAIAGAIAVAFKPLKAVKAVAAGLAGAAFVAALVCLIVYYSTGDASEWNGIEITAGDSAVLYVSAAVLTATMIAVAFITDRTKGFDTRAITFAAICIALSFALSYIRLLRMPFGGSITFASMLPLMLYSYMFGCKKGLIAGLVYGMLQAIQDAWIFHPAQFALDYLVAFMAIGLTGCLRNVHTLKDRMRTKFTLGSIIAGVTRFISHFFSGVFAFGAYGVTYAEQWNIPALSNPYIYSIVYQSLYIIPEMVIVIVVGVLMLSSANLRKQIARYGNFEKTAEHVPSEEIPAAGNAQ